MTTIAALIRAELAKRADVASERVAKASEEATARIQERIPSLDGWTATERAIANQSGTLLLSGRFQEAVDASELIRVPSRLFAVRLLMDSTLVDMARRRVFALDVEGAKNLVAWASTHRSTEHPEIPSAEADIEAIIDGALIHVALRQAEDVSLQAGKELASKACGSESVEDVGVAMDSLLAELAERAAELGRFGDVRRIAAWASTRFAGHDDSQLDTDASVQVMIWKVADPSVFLEARLWHGRGNLTATSNVLSWASTPSARTEMQNALQCSVDYRPTWKPPARKFAAKDTLKAIVLPDNTEDLSGRAKRLLAVARPAHRKFFNRFPTALIGALDFDVANRERSDGIENPQLSVEDVRSVCGEHAVTISNDDARALAASLYVLRPQAATAAELTGIVVV